MRARLLASAACLVLAAGAAARVPACAATASLEAGPTLGSTLDGLRQAGRALSPSLLAAALDTAAASAKAGGADRLDDPVISDSIQYYKDPGVYSAHAVMLSQSFPLWGKRSLRRQAALAEVDAARGREAAARDEIDERIKVGFAQWVAVDGEQAINREVLALARRMRAATAARYGQGGGDAAALIRVLGEETTAKAEAIRLAGECQAAAAQLNVLAGRRADAPLAPPGRVPALPAVEIPLPALLDRASAANATLAARSAELAAARSQRVLAAKAWYPDVTVGGGPLIQTNDRPVGFAATVSVNIPVGWGREAAGEREAEARLGASEHRYDAARLEVQGAVAEAASRLHAARATLDLLRREAAPQARAMVQAALAEYRQGQGDLATVIAAAHQDHDVALRRLQVELDARTEQAAIERLAGGDL